MNYKELLPDFIDGMLSPEEERAIHYQLSQDEELYREYKNLQQIFSSINESKNSYIPSSELTQKVFSALEIKYFPTEKNKLFEFINKGAFKYAAAIVTLLLMLTLQFNNIEQIPNYGNQNSASNNNNTNYSSLNSNDNLNIQSSTSDNNLNDNVASIKNKSKRNIKKSNNQNDNYLLSESLIKSSNEINSQNIDDNIDFNSYYQDKEIQNQFNASNDITSSATSDIDINEEIAYFDSEDYTYEDANQTNYFNNSDYSTPINMSQGFNYLNSDFAYNNYKVTYFSLPSSKFSIEFKNTIYFNTVKSKLNTELVNIGLALYYNVIENLSIGIDVRNESFQKLSYKSYAPTLERSNSYSFTNTNKNDDLPFSSTEVFATTLGLAVKYNWTNFSKNFIPTTQLNIGTNSEGLVGRLQLGMHLFASNGISANVGVEYSSLAYKFANTSNNTNKLGINLGLAYNIK